MNKLVQLGEIASIVMGQAPPGKDCNKEGNGYPFVKAGEFSTNHPIIREWTTNPLKKAQTGDVLVCVVGATAGKINLGIDCAIGRSVAAVRPSQEFLDTNYLNYFLQTKTALMRHGSQGLAQGVITRKMLLEIDIPLPQLEEQRRISAILDKASELEALSIKQSKLLQDTEKHLFLEYFGLPFPGRTPWPVTQLSQLGFLERGVSKHRPRNDPSLMNGPYPFIQTGDVAGCRGKITSFSTTYSEKGLAQSRLWKAGTLCITIAANIAKTGILDFDACFPDSVVGFQNKNPAIITYIQCWMSFLQSHIEQMAPESAQKNINLEILRGLTVPVPSEDKLDNFHAAILLLRNTWATSMHRHQRIKELKSSLQSATFAS